jgi:hypothetical protein
MCRKSDDETMDQQASSEDDDDDDESNFPYEELCALQRRHRSLSRPLPNLDRIPTACGILQNLQLVGIFPTARWLTDPTMPPDVREMFGGTPFFPLGEYRVAHLEVQDAVGSKKALTFIVNSGVKGMLTSYWGGAFSREGPHSCWARFQGAGEFEATIAGQQSKRKRNGEEWSFQEFDCLEFCEESFKSGSAPGKCNSQLERLLGIGVEFLLDLDWKTAVPEAMIEICDMSPRMERRRRARRRATPRALSKKLLF